MTRTPASRAAVELLDALSSKNSRRIGVARTALRATLGRASPKSVKVEGGWDCAGFDREGRPVRMFVPD